MEIFVHVIDWYYLQAKNYYASFRANIILSYARLASEYFQITIKTHESSLQTEEIQAPKFVSNWLTRESPTNLSLS